MNLSSSSIFEPVTEPEILESIKSLPTEDDLPYDDGEPMESERHLMQMIVLIQSLKEGWSTPRSYYVGGNMFLHYELNSEKKFRGPDFFLVLDVSNRERKSWVVWQEGMRFPDLIIEILSDKTREIDKGEKKELYERIFRTPEYYLFDPFSQEFIGLKLRDGSYEEELPDKEGKIYSKVTGLYLIVKDGWLRWMTQEGVILPTPSERADQEKQRADQAEQRAKQLEQLLEEYKRRFGSLKE
jgi:Uma2 family endonuclease